MSIKFKRNARMIARKILRCIINRISYTFIDGYYMAFSCKHDTFFITIHCVVYIEQLKKCQIHRILLFEIQSEFWTNKKIKNSITKSTKNLYWLHITEQTYEIQIFYGFREEKRFHSIFQRFIDNVVYCSIATLHLCECIKRLKNVKTDTKIKRVLCSTIQHVR